MPKQKNAHYVDNKKFHQAMIEWKEKCKDAEEAGDDIPRISDYIGECFLKIANGLSYRPNFINYTYRQEMISDGIENCLQYIYTILIQKNLKILLHILHKSYIMHLFVGYKKKKKQSHVKHKMIEKQDFVQYTTMAGDYTNYNIGGFDPNTMLPDEAVYKPKRKKVKTHLKG